jgi:transcriptional regulator with XRE-family HTH domain
MIIPQLPDKLEVGAEIKRIADKKGLTVQQIATAVGASKTHVRNIFHGEAGYLLMKKTLEIVENWKVEA